jgi:AcrR family transcriptional regulator
MPTVPQMSPTRSREREGGHVQEMQRRRLLTATTELVYERRMSSMTVAVVCDRARVSRKTFYDLFERMDECLLAAFDDGATRARTAVVRACAGEQGWYERVRAGLGGLLGFLDREPGIGRLLVVDALAAGEQTLQARARLLAEVIPFVDEGRKEVKTGRQPAPLTAEGIVGAVCSIIHARMVAGSPGGESESRPLAELNGALMAMIVQPYLGAAAAQKELERKQPMAQNAAPRVPADPFKDLQIRVTYRTARVLATIAADPGASNRHIGTTAGAPDQGQVSKLLGRLQRSGLIENHGRGHASGEPNAWCLTPRGQAVHAALGDGAS